jgi:hypothetical protein
MHVLKKMRFYRDVFLIRTIMQSISFVATNIDINAGQNLFISAIPTYNNSIG